MPGRKLNATFEQNQFEEKQEEVIKPTIQKQLLEEVKQEEKQTLNPPEDWLEPKIYKGSTSF